jgi:hypothetical protein
MSPIELPRALQDYFAYAETEPTRRGRRFSITLAYYTGERIERMQWWYHVSPAEEQMFEGKALAVLRRRATERFCVHIERWLGITHQRLHGDEPIPRVSAVPVAAAAEAAAAVLPWPLEKLASGQAH